MLRNRHNQQTIWQNNNVYINPKDQGQMFNTFNYNPNNPSIYYGYPNLGRPSDHFQVTPFEAIFCGNQIQPHIRLNKATTEYRSALTGFIFDEVEPWYLGLQNQTLGSQARNDYTYKAERRAKHHIVIGHLVTPTTDPGDYIVQPNADLNLRAGDLIHIKPGTHFMAGSTVHAQIEYWPCHIEIEDFEPIIPDPWGNGGGMLEPIPQESEDESLLAKERDSLDDVHSKVIQNEQIQSMALNSNKQKKNLPNESCEKVEIVAIRENEVEFKTSVL